MVSGGLSVVEFCLVGRVAGVGEQSGRLSCGEHLVARVERGVALAVACAVARTWGVGCRRGVRRAPGLRGVGWTNCGVKKHAFAALFPAELLGLSALRGKQSIPTIRNRSAGASPSP